MCRHYCSVHSPGGRDAQKGCTGLKEVPEGSQSLVALEYDLPANATVADALCHFTKLLEAHSVPEAELSTQHLLAAALVTTRAELESQCDRVLSSDEREILKRYIICRVQRMPVQYIVGDWDFHNITLDLWPPVFIPRPETEQLVEQVVQFVHSWSQQDRPRLLEFCAGSGAISLALLHACPQVSATVVEQSGRAIALAAHNAHKLGLLSRLSLVHAKIERRPLSQLPCSSYDIIVSNPPYVPSKALAKLEPEIFLYEDLRALDGGTDGLDVIRNILWHSAELLSDGGRLFLEVDQTHGSLLPAWLEEQKHKAEGASLQQLFVDQVEKDVFGKVRYIMIVKRKACDGS
ncbi:Modification methylase HemK [Trinorchestia longiramus]|nr:Modification methylase HemK [Trinorchestia longiramus]